MCKLQAWQGRGMVGGQEKVRRMQGEASSVCGWAGLASERVGGGIRHEGVLIPGPAKPVVQGMLAGKCR